MIEEVCVLTVIEPVTAPPGPSGIMVTVLSSPSAAALPATLVPRMPSVATGVRTTISSGLLAAISPLTNTNTPCTNEKLEEPSSEVGSKINSSSTMRPSSPSENSVSSMNTTATAPPAPVSRISPWKTDESLFNVTVVPSTRVAVTSPTASSTRPIGASSIASSDCAY